MLQHRHSTCTAVGTCVAHIHVVDDLQSLVRAKATRLHIAYKIDFIEARIDSRRRPPAGDNCTDNYRIVGPLLKGEQKSGRQL